jgi:hypothetical protein
MAGAAADTETTTTRLGLPTTSRCVHQHEGEHVHKMMFRYASKAGIPGLGQQTRGDDLTCPCAAKQGLGGVGWVDDACEGLRMRARDRACRFKTVPALAPPGRKRLLSGDASALGGWSDDKRRLGTAKGLTLAQPEDVRTCVNARRAHTCGFARVCARA